MSELTCQERVPKIREQVNRALKRIRLITADIYLEPREEGSRFTRLTVLIGIMITSDEMRPKDDTQQASCHAAKRK